MEDYIYTYLVPQTLQGGEGALPNRQETSAEHYENCNVSEYRLGSQIVPIQHPLPALPEIHLSYLFRCYKMPKPKDTFRTPVDRATWTFWGIHGSGLPNPKPNKPQGSSPRGSCSSMLGQRPWISNYIAFRYLEDLLRRNLTPGS